MSLYGSKLDTIFTGSCRSRGTEDVSNVEMRRMLKSSVGLVDRLNERGTDQDIGMSTR